MALRRNDANFRDNIAGVPMNHEFAFRTVAQSQRCVIISRCVGPTCRQLLLQGYDTKGFRIHGKSCDWGPMAGFVLRDPRLNKAGMEKAGYNRREHREALTDQAAAAGWMASVTPLRLFQSRVDWLVAQRLIQVVPRGADRLEGRAVHPTGIAFHYSLIKVPTPAGEMWGVYLDRTKNAVRQNAAANSGFVQERGGAVVAYDTRYGDMYEPLLAMTNPPGHRHIAAEHPLNAITGDYDLFAVWPFLKGANRYDRHGEDRRVLGTARAWSERHRIEDELERNFTQPVPNRPPGFIGPLQTQGTKLGNMTNRLYTVGQFVNSVVAGVVSAEGGPFPNRNVIWHSDEAARPFVDDVDLPLIAFLPGGDTIGIETIADFRAFTSVALLAGLMPTLAEGWTMAPTAQKPNRLGPAFAFLVPADWGDGQWMVPRWYNA